MEVRSQLYAPAALSPVPMLDGSRADLDMALKGKSLPMLGMSSNLTTDSLVTVLTKPSGLPCGKHSLYN